MSNDRPSPWSLAGHQQGWAAAPPQTYAPEPPRVPPALAPYVAERPLEVRLLGQAPRGQGLAVTGVVLGGLAFLGALLALLVALFALGVGSDDEGGYAYGVRGTATPTKGSMTGSQLAEEVTRTVTGLGGFPEEVTCPATTQVAQDVTAVCHGTDYGDDATFVVFFEDDRGAYTLLEI